MKKTFFIIILLLISTNILIAASSVLGYSAKNISYNYKKNKIILKNNALIKYEDMVLKANKIIFLKENNIIYAFGNVDFKSTSNSFICQKLKYNLDIKKAVIKKGKIPIKKGIVKGNSFNVENEDTIYSKNSYFTSCKNINPHYSVHTRKMKVIKDNKILISPVIFKIGNIPVFFLPSYLIPIPKKRTTGFLQPSISNNTIDGITYTQPFFLVINKFSDFTYTLKAMSNRGVKHTGEFRYKTFNGHGNIESNYIYDNLKNTKRWEIKGYASQSINSLGVDSSLHIDYSSDTSFKEDFEDNFYNRTKNSSSSYIVFEKQFKNKLYAKFKGSRNQTWKNISGETTNKETEILLPELVLSLYSTQIFNKLYLSGKSITQNMYKNNEFYELQFENSFNFTYKHKLFKFFHFNEKINNNFDYFKAPDYKLNRWVPNFDLSTYTNIYGYFNFLNIGSNNKIKHIITPRINYSYTPNISQNRFVNNNKNVINEQNYINYSLNNSFITKKKNKRKITFLTLKTSTSQNLLKKNKQFSLLSNSLKLNPINNKKFRFSFSFNQEYNLYDNKTISISSYNRFNINLKNYNFNITLNHTKNFENKSTITTLKTRSDINLTKKWHLNHNLLYDIKNKKIRLQSFELQRDLHCWKMNLEWEERENGVINYKFFIGLNAFKSLKYDYKDEIEPIEYKEE